MVRLMRTRYSGALGRARTTATVAARSDSSTKKCDAWKPSVEVSELIVQPLAQRGVVAGGARDGRHGPPGRGVATGPADGDETENRGARQPDAVRQQPREHVQPLVDRRRQRLLAAVLRHVVVVHLLAGHPLRDEPRQFRAHGGGLRALAVR